MCGRYGLFVSKKQIKEHYQLKEDFFDFVPRYNVPPGLVMPVIINSNGNNHISMMKWGLVPSWAKDETIGYKIINARIETLQEKPSFNSLLTSNRCLIPASGYFEWKYEKNKKQPYYIKVKNSEIFSFAGLFSQWKKPDGNILQTYTIITKTADKELEYIHNRMPVIIDSVKESEWLSSNQTHPTQLLQNEWRGSFEAYPVSTLVNNPKYNDERVILKEFDI